MAKVKHIQIDNTPTEWEANAIYFVRNTGQIWQTDSNGLAVNFDNMPIFNHTGKLCTRSDMRCVGVSYTDGIGGNGGMCERYTANGTSLDILSWYDNNRAPMFRAFMATEIKEGLYIRFGGIADDRIKNKNYQLIMMTADREEDVYGYQNKDTLLVETINNIYNFSERFVPKSAFFKTTIEQGKLLFFAVRITTDEGVNTFIRDVNFRLI